MSRRWFSALLLSLACSSGVLAAEAPRGLDIYFIDVEGGAATLIVTPAGESLLVDCGNPGSRDGERIAKAAQAAGLKAIDHLWITHWHSDHYGGVAKLTQLIPVNNFYDHGIPETLAEDSKGFPLLIGAYKTATGGKSKTLKVGDEIKLKQVDKGPPLKLLCVCSGGRRAAGQAGRRREPYCQRAQADGRGQVG